MNAAETIYTRMLTPDEVGVVLNALPSLLWDLAGDCILVAEYGCGCNIHDDLQYVPMQVGIGWLDKFLAESKDQRIFIPAKSDLSISTPNAGVSILFCHESDIHIVGQDSVLVERAIKSEVLRPLLRTNAKIREGV